MRSRDDALPKSNQTLAAENYPSRVVARQAAAVDARFDARAIPADAVEGWWHARDGIRLRRFDRSGGGAAGSRRGRLLYLPGRGDAYEKYLEAFGHWHARGWAVTAIDWRGQAGSGRLGLDMRTGHVNDFGVWADDLAAFWQDWRGEGAIGGEGGAPHVVVAHSMGGHLALRALAERRIDADAVVLTAPMLGLRPGFVPAAVLHRVARAIAALGDPRRPAWGHGETPIGRVDRAALLTGDAQRYADEAWWHGERPELEMGPASWGWIAAALASIRVLSGRGALAHIAMPVMMIAAAGDRLVDAAAIRRAAARLPRGETCRFARPARHELLRDIDAVRDAVLAAIDEFLDRAAPAPGSGSASGQGNR